MTAPKVEHVLTERVNCASFQLSFCTQKQVVRTLANAVTSALDQVLHKRSATLFLDVALTFATCGRIAPNTKVHLFSGLSPRQLLTIVAQSPNFLVCSTQHCILMNPDLLSLFLWHLLSSPNFIPSHFCLDFCGCKQFISLYENVLP